MERGSTEVRRPMVLAVLGPTAVGKSRLAITLATRVGGEVVNCDSTAVYRGFDIGTDKVPAAEQAGVPHHLIDIVDPTEVYTAARFAADANRVIRDIHARGKIPIVTGGTGLYYRALVQGLFPGPAADEVLRARLAGVAARRGAPALHRWLARVDRESGRRIAPADVKKVVRALEVFLLTGKPLSAHFADTVSPIADCDVVAMALKLDAAQTAERVARRVDTQFSRGIVEEVRGLLARGVPRSARPFGGLVYRQVVEMLDGVRGPEETRALIVTANVQYARRQLIWFRKEPNLRWFDGPGEDPCRVDHIVSECATIVSEKGADVRGSRV